MPMMKFRPDVIEKVLEAASVGCSQETAAAIAGIDDTTLTRWLKRGRAELAKAEDPDNLSAYAQFAMDWAEKQARTNQRALAIIYREMDTNPQFAWKYIERREKQYAPPAPAAPAVQQGPVLIQLTLSNGAPLAPRTVIDVEDAYVEDDDGNAASPEDRGEAAPVVSLADRGSEQ